MIDQLPASLLPALKGTLLLHCVKRANHPKYRKRLSGNRAFLKPVSVDLSQVRLALPDKGRGATVRTAGDQSCSIQ